MRVTGRGLIAEQTGQSNNEDYYAMLKSIQQASPQQDRPNKRMRVRSPESRGQVAGERAPDAAPPPVDGRDPSRMAMGEHAAVMSNSNMPPQQPPPPYIPQPPPQQLVFAQHQQREQQPMPPPNQEQLWQQMQAQHAQAQQQMRAQQQQRAQRRTSTALTVAGVREMMREMARSLAEQENIPIEEAWAVIAVGQQGGMDTARPMELEAGPNMNAMQASQLDKSAQLMKKMESTNKQRPTMMRAAHQTPGSTSTRPTRADPMEAKEGLAGPARISERTGEAGSTSRTRDPRMTLSASETALIARYRITGERLEVQEEVGMDVDPVGALRPPPREDPMGVCSAAGLPGHIPVEALQAVERSRSAEMEQDGDDERTRREREKEMYRKALRELDLVEAPEEIWPRIQNRSAYDRVRGLQSDAYQDWKAADEAGKMLLEIARHGDLDDETVARWAAKLEHVLQAVVRTSDYTLAVPPRRPEAKDGATPNKVDDISTVFMVSGAPPLAIEVFVEQFAVCTKEVAFWAIKSEKDIPEYIGAMDGFMQSSESAAAKVLQKHLKKEAIFTSIANLVKDCPRFTQMHVMTATFHVIDTLRVRMVREDVNDGGSPLVAHVYMDRPTDNGLKWDEWLTSLRSFPLPEASGRKVLLRAEVRCEECHGVDHENKGCPYRAIEEWRMRTEGIEKAMKEKKLKAKAKASVTGAKGGNGARPQEIRRQHGGQGGPSGPPRHNQIDNRWNRGEGPPFGNHTQQMWNQGGGHGMGGQNGFGQGMGQATRPPRR